jgi:integrase
LELAKSETVGAYLDRWWRDVLPMSRRVTGTTKSNYDTMIRCHLRPALGDILLDALTAKTVNDMLRNMVRKGKSQSTARVARTVLVLALGDAVVDGLVPVNVAAQTKAPRGTTKTRRSLTVDEARSLLAAAEGTPLVAAWKTAIYLGLRPGEVRGLAWSDIDFDAGTLKVVHAQRRDGGQLIARGQTKTASAVRTLRLPSPILDALKRHRDDQAAERITAGDRWEDTDGLVFTTKDGAPIRPETYRREFRKVVATAGISGDLVPHELRHTAASIMSDQGIRAEVIGDILGHADGGELVMKTYRHSLAPILDGHLAIGDDLLTANAS